MVGQEIGGGQIKMGIKDAKRFALLVPLLGIVIHLITAQYWVMRL